MYPYINLFGKELPSYGVMSVLGMAAVLLFSAKCRKRLGIPVDDTLHLLLLSVVGALVGAKLLYIITIIPYLAKLYPDILSHAFEDSSALLEILLNGYVFYGGLLGALLAAWLYSRKYSVDFTAVGALFAAAAPLFHAFGRVGCFLAGCCYGVESGCGVVFTHSLNAPNGVSLLPVQLIESAADLMIFFAVLIYQKRKLKGSLSLYLVSYSLCRFVLEFFRGDIVRGHLLGFSTSQWIAAAVIIVIAIRKAWGRTVPSLPSSE